MLSSLGMEFLPEKPPALCGRAALVRLPEEAGAASHAAKFYKASERLGRGTGEGPTAARTHSDAHAEKPPPGSLQLSSQR